MTLRSLSLILVLAACSSRREPTPSTGSGSGAGSAIVQPIDAAIVPDAVDASLKEHMLDHFGAITELQRAIARGHLDDARRHARWIAEHDDGMLAAWKPMVDEMKVAAKAVVDARDLPMAAALAARLGRACSSCHEAHSAVVTFAWAPAPEDDGTLSTQMKRHQWAAARLWDGLVGPSDEMWKQGTSELAVTRLDTAAASNGTPRGDVAALASKVRELAGRAQLLTDHDDRAKLYGELLSTCAGCHQLVRPQPVPGP